MDKFEVNDSVVIRETVDGIRGMTGVITALMTNDIISVYKVRIWGKPDELEFSENVLEKVEK